MPVRAVSLVRNGDNGGANVSRAQLSAVQVSTARDRFEILRTIEGQ
ncbi:MAG: hypothetical protein KDK08_24640 [Rhizobiaceae bacterium]|nr:hypothetical protein [Rhizobiaceae bacterium]